MVGPALQRLRTAADTVRAGWLPAQWRRCGDGRTATMQPRVVQGDPYGVFTDLELRPGTTIELECDLAVPGEIAGVDVTGRPLELTMSSLYPITVRAGGRVVLDAGGVPVAAGPALVEVVPSVSGRGDGCLRLEVRTPRSAVPSIAADLVPPWIWLHLTSPALRERFFDLDLAWARLLLADTMAEGGERSLVEDVAATVPEDAQRLDAEDLADLGQRLAPLTQRAEVIDLHLVGHSHIDLAWLWTWADTQEVVERDLTTVLALLDDFPELRFTHSQPVTYEVLRTRHPAAFERVRAHAAGGRWEPATLQWVESDLNLPSGEALARQLLEGVTWTRQHLDQAPEVFLAPDTFGAAGNIPQLAVSAGATTYYHHRCVPGSPPWPAYWWEGDDGTRILALSTALYLGQITPGSVAEAAVRAIGAGHSTALDLFGIGDHGGGPTRQSLEALRQLQACQGVPRAHCSTLAAYRDALLSSGTGLPVHRGGTSFTFRGCYTTHTDAKAMNRQAEAALVAAEALAVLAGLGHCEELVDAWRSTLFQQFHDILGGSSIRDVYDDQAEANGRVLAAASDVARRATSCLHAGLAPGSVAVTNTHGFACEEVVEVEWAGADGSFLAHGPDAVARPAVGRGGRLAFTASVPAFATVAYEVRPAGEDPPPALAFAVTEEAITFDDGCRQIRIDRTDGSIHAAGPGSVEAELNVLELVVEEPVGMSAWVIGDTRSEERLPAATRVEVAEADAVRVCVDVEHRVRSSTVRQRIVLAAGSPRIDVFTTIDWHEPGSSTVGIPGLKVGCRLPSSHTEFWRETAFAAATTTDTEEVPALGWAAVEDGSGAGVAVLSDCRHGVDASAGRLRLRLVRSGYEPDPAADIGAHAVRLSFLPFRSGWRSASLPQHAAALRTPLVAAVVGDGEPAPAARAWSPVVDTEGGVVVAALKPARRGPGAVLRAYDATGGGGTLRLGGLGGAGVRRVSVVEDDEGIVAVEGGEAAVAVGPFEVVSLLVEEERPR